MHKKNCWEFMLCGREQGGDRAAELGVCPVALSNPYDNVNRGRYAGRFCWAVKATSSNKRTYAENLLNCFNCEFQKLVQEEEGRQFVLLPTKASTIKLKEMKDDNR